MNWKVLPLLLVVTSIAGITPIAAAAATSELPPLSMAAARFFVAGVLMGITARALGMKLRIQDAYRTRVLWLAALCVPINQIGFLVGVKHAGAAHAGIAYALVPVLVFWVSSVADRIRPGLRMFLASSLAFAGAGMVIWRARGGAVPATMTTAWGDVLLFSAALSWAIYSVSSRSLVRELGAPAVLTSVFLIGSIMHVPIVVVDLLWFKLGRLDLAAVSTSAWLGFVFITVVTAYLNYMLWFLVISRFDVTRSSIVTNSSFLLTVTIEWAAGRLDWNPLIGIGSLVLLTGIVLANLRRVKRQEHKT